VGMEEDFSQVLQRVYPQETVSDNEVLLSFNDDDTGLLFREWMHQIGWDIFKHFVERQ
jgi:hypothetical protein